MADLFILALLGHLTGDYLLQSKKMALGKSESGLRGVWWCTAHMILYTAAVCLFLWTIHPLIISLVFVPHWIIDRWSLASVWLKLIRGRTFEAAYQSKEKYREFDVAFTCLVYAVADNTMHLITLWLMIRFVML